VALAVVSPPVAAPHRRRTRVRRRIGQVAYYLLVIAVVAVTFFPIYWMIVSTIQPTKFSLHYPPPLIPRGIQFQPFRNLFDSKPIASWIWHSTLLALLATAICVLLAILGAFTISSMRWTGRSAFAVFLLMTQMLPEALIVVPIFRIFTDFPVIHADLRDHLYELSLIDAAFILPLTLPGLVAVGVVAFFYAWNEYLFAQLFIQEKDLYPAAVGLGQMKTMLDTPIEQQLAAGLLFAIPPVIFYLVMQRYIVTGITAGAVKG